MGSRMCPADPSELRGVCQELPRALGVRLEASLLSSSPCRPPSCPPSGKSTPIAFTLGFFWREHSGQKEVRGPQGWVDSMRAPLRVSRPCP